MADKREPRKRTRRPVKKATKKVANSKIGEAQKAATERRKERDSPRGQAGTPGQGRFGPTESKSKVAAGGPADPSNAVRPGQAKPGTGVPSGTPAGTGERGRSPEDVAGQSMREAAQKIAGLSAPVMKSMQAKAAEDRRNNPLSTAALYGGPIKDRAKRLSDAITATNQANTAKAKSQGQAVWMGPTPGKVKTRVIGDMPDEPGADTYLKTAGEQILTKAELMSWLGDEKKVQQIMAVAQKAGLAVETYDDAAKLWASVVDMAAQSYSAAGKQVTPWALIQLRGKYAGADGKMKPKISTNTSIDEMDPAQARLMFEQTAQQALGRSPTKAEVDDFIAKAQTIARQNPVITTTTSQVGFDGETEAQNSTSVTKGQGAAAAKSQLAAMDQAKQTEDYAAYQAAGNYFPMLFEALQSPV